MANALYNDQDLLLLVNSGVPNIDCDQDLLVLVTKRLVVATVNFDADQDLCIVVNSGVPKLDCDQDLMLIVAQRLVPALIQTNIDQDLFIIVERLGLHGTLAVSPTTVLGNGSATATITATVFTANGLPAIGVAVTLSQNGFSTISPAVGVTDANGVATFTVTDTFAELVTYTAHGTSFNTTVTVQFEASRVDGTVYGQRGPALAGAQVYAVHQPANLSSVPPTPLLNIYADLLGKSPIAQPVITDGLGNYKFYAGDTLFTLVVNNGTAKQVFADQEAGKPSAAFHNLEWWVKSAGGPSIPGAQVFILDNIPNLPTTLGKGKPNPQQQVFSDPNGITSLVQPLITDSYGYTDCYVAAGVYTVAVYLGGRLQVTYPDQSVGAIYAGPMARYDGWVRNALGVAQPNARVLVSAQPCSIPGALVPEFPSNLAAIYSDPNGYAPVTQSLTYVNGNPVISSLTTDGDGHFNFYAAPNVAYTVSIYIQNKLQQFLPDQVL